MGLVSSVIEKVKLRWMRRDEYESLALRRWFKERYHIEVGLYSYGCFDPWRTSGRTRIGRYCSFARSARILDANHPMEALTTHPFLYDPKLGVIENSRIDAEWLNIEDDVWVSHNVTITPGCKHVGRGAIIGAGAIVTHDVEPYAIVTGMPARTLRYRFDPDTIAAIEASRWWEASRAELKDMVARDPDGVFKPTAAFVRR